MRGLKPRLYRLPQDYEKMPIGYYLRLGKNCRWHIMGQKSEMDNSRKQLMYGPIPMPELETSDFVYAGVKPVWVERRRKS